MNKTVRNIIKLNIHIPVGYTGMPILDNQQRNQRAIFFLGKFIWFLMKWIMKTILHKMVNSATLLSIFLTLIKWFKYAIKMYGNRGVMQGTETKPF